MDGGAPTTETGAASLMRSLRGRGVSVVFANPGTTGALR